MEHTARSALEIFTVAILIRICTQVQVAALLADDFYASGDGEYSSAYPENSSGDGEDFSFHYENSSIHPEYFTGQGKDIDTLGDDEDFSIHFTDPSLPHPEESLEKSKKLLTDIQRSLRTSSTNAHKIASITAKVQKIVEANHFNSSDQQELVHLALRIPLLLLTNGTVSGNILPENGRSLIGYELLFSIEKIILTLSRTLKEGIENINFVSDELTSSEFSASFGVVESSNNKLEVIYPNPSAPQDSFIKVTAAGLEISDGSRSFVGVSIDSEYIENIMPPSFNRLGKNKLEKSSPKIINSKVVISLTVQGLPSAGQARSGNIKTMLTFHHKVDAYGDVIQNIPRRLHPGERPLAVRGSTACVFWSQKENLWLTDGCVVSKTSLRTTLCICDHLTSFAVIMDVHNYVGKDSALEVLTLILCPPSALSLVICIVLLPTVKSIRNQRTTITINLCACLLIGIILILFVADRNYLYLSHEACVAVGILTHYVYLAAFTWMGMEGVCLYKMIIQVFHSHRSPTNLYVMLGYGVPAVVVGITCAVGFGLDDEPYGNDLYCWLNGNYHWGFAGPALVITLGNIIVLSLVLKTAQRKGPEADGRKRSSYKKLIQGSFSITILLGITWLPGFFLFTDSAELATISAYIFVLFNASQGIFLFVFNCVLNQKVSRFVREATRRVRLPLLWSSASVPQETQMTQSVNRTTTET